MENEIVKLKQYLLGNLSSSEAEEIDLQIIADESLEEKLAWAESELAEDFLEGTLSPQETELFHKNFLISPERENQLKHIALFKKYAQDACLPEQSAETDDESPDNFFQRLKDFFASNRRPVTAVFALLIICLALGITWKIFFSAPNVELTQLEKEYAAKNSGDLSNITGFVNLSAGTSRDSSSDIKLKHEKLPDDVLFGLALPAEVGDETLFSVQLLKDEKAVFRQNQIRVYRNRSGQEIRLFLPKSVLAKGRYQIKLENTTAKNLTANYNFTVE
ncbi:MAG TPA: hypothetical protein VF721_16115 [Pyrinomonadaceae bacterium]